MRKIVVSLSIVAALAACGNSTKVGSPSTSSGEPTPSQTVAAGGGGGYCGLAKDYQNSSSEISQAFKNIDFSNPDKAKQQLADAYRKLAPTFKDAFAKAIAIAPDEIKGDLKTLGDAYTKFLDAMAKVNYDFTKIDQNTSRVFQDPAIQAAAEHVGKYGADHCGIPYTPNGGASTVPAGGGYSTPPTTGYPSGYSS